jgi:hypothetical protein
MLVAVLRFVKLVARRNERSAWMTNEFWRRGQEKTKNLSVVGCGLSPALRLHSRVFTIHDPGYSAESWRIHTESIEGILTRFDRG